MGCDRYAESISALVDGEEPEISTADVETHVAACPGCRELRRDLELARRRSRVSVVPGSGAAGADAVAAARHVVTEARRADRMSVWQPARILLAVVAFEVVVLSAIDLVNASGPGEDTHDVRHLSSFTIAYGVLLLLVVARPARARTALPVAGILAVALAVTACVDLVRGRIPLVDEALHLPELVSVPLVWMLAVPRRNRWHRS